MESNETPIAGHQPASSAPLSRFDWPLAHEAEAFLRGHIAAFLARNDRAHHLAERLPVETGTDFYEWVDHLTLAPSREPALRSVGFVPENVPAPGGWRVFHHPRAMMPRVVLQDDGESAGVPARLAIRPEFLSDFVARHNLPGPIRGSIGARLREVSISRADGHEFVAVERMAWRGFVADEPTPAFLRALVATRELWRTRQRAFTDSAEGFTHATQRQRDAIARVGRDVACELFFAEERAFWELRNTAARVQKRRQDLLGLGWGNHDHHTYRSSRERFADLTRFLLNFGFEKRERYYAGAEAGWGAQISEHAVTGITVFADVDLMPEETAVDFSTHPLPAAPRLRTVGLWCGLHGDSFLQAGMHHLEARFDFTALRDQLERDHGVKTMKPFSDFPFLKQAFTEGERWRVDPVRVQTLQERKLITPEQAESFIRDGAIGSHLENLQRRGGFKGFNQKSVSVIIAATDPRQQQVAHGP